MNLIVNPTRIPRNATVMINKITFCACWYIRQLRKYPNNVFISFTSQAEQVAASVGECSNHWL